MPHHELYIAAVNSDRRREAAQYRRHRAAAAQRKDGRLSLRLAARLHPRFS